MNEIRNIPCRRCRTREASIAAYAEDIIACDALVASLETDNRALREILSVALERLSALTVAHRHQRDRISTLLQELRVLRARSTMRSAA